MTISDRTTCAILIAQQAAQEAKDILAGDVDEAIVKVEQDGSHHSLLTKADKESQKHIVTALRAKFPGIRFLCEEKALGPDVITSADLSPLLDRNQLVAIVDPVDGTAGASRQLADWSVAVNFYQGGQFSGGVVVAPDLRGGLTVFAEAGVGTYFVEDWKKKAYVSQCVEPKKAHIYLGVDVLKRHHFAKFIGVAANAVQTAHVAGSCALGTALVAIGRSDAIVQCAQWPWDWAAAPSLVLPAGGKVLYYHYRQGEPVLLDQPDLAAFNGDKSQRIGFIAGAPKIVEWLWVKLQENWIK